jgi:ABC-2 type transport system permease protein
VPTVRSGPLRILQVAGGLIRASLAVAMQYRADFLIDGVTGLLRAGGTLAPIALVFAQRDVVMGWTAEEVTLVAGLYFLMAGLITGLVEPNLGEVVESIRTGGLDFLLLKPADAQLLASFRRVAPAHVWDLVAAALMIGWALSAMPPPSAADWFVAALMLVAGFLAMYGVWILAICASFWFVRVDNLRFLLWSVSDAGRWPLDVFGRWVRFLLIVVVPVGVLTTFPALALRGTWNGWIVLLGCAVAVASLSASRWAWNRSLASYTSASS